jgi:hypothetical protein
VALDAVPRLVGHTRGFDLNPARRTRWVVEDLVESVPDIEMRAAAAREIVARAPTLSERHDLLYKFRRSGEPSKSPGLGLLDEQAFKELEAALSEAVVNADGDALARERDVLWLVATVRDASGRPAALARLSDQRVLVRRPSADGNATAPSRHGRTSP